MPGMAGTIRARLRDGVREKDLTLDVALRLERLLKASGVGDEADAFERRNGLALDAARRWRTRSAIACSSAFTSTKASATAASGIGTFYAARQTAPVPLVASWFPFVAAGLHRG